jgi:hypothetical protein
LKFPAALTSSILTPPGALPYSRTSGLFIPLSSIYARVSSGIWASFSRNSALASSDFSEQAKVFFYM